MVYRILMFFLGRNFVSSLNLYTKSTKPNFFSKNLGFFNPGVDRKKARGQGGSKGRSG